MLCPKCQRENPEEAHRCQHCGANLAVAVLEVVRGDSPEKVHFLRPRSYTVGRARHNDITLTEGSISKSHAHLRYEGGRFSVEDAGSLHGVYVNAARVQRAELVPGCEVQLGNVTLKFSSLADEGATDRMTQLPWIEQQQLLLSVVQTLNATLVLAQVLEQVLDAVMRITRAERGFLLLQEMAGEAGRYESVAGLGLRAGRRRDGGELKEVHGISSSVVRRALEAGQTVATGNALADPALRQAESVVSLELRTIVCIPLRSPRAELMGEGGKPGALGAIYVDNPQTSAAFAPDRLKAAEALARHAALAIENAQLFEREQRTIEELRLAQRQLLQSEKLATIGQMSAGIAHELNTPLTYIVGNVELLQMKAADPRERELLDAVAKGAERIRNLVASLLTFSRPQEHPTRLQLNDVIERSLELCQYQILKGGVRLERRLAGDLPAVMGVASQLEMAVINLVVNAIHAMSGQGVLTVTSRRAGPEVEVLVSDTGPGIPENIRSSIFEPFFTTKPEGKGTGLGLSTVLMVVERHKGRIDLVCAPGAGTTFRIALPASA